MIINRIYRIADTNMIKSRRLPLTCYLFLLTAGILSGLLLFVPPVTQAAPALDASALQVTINSASARYGVGLAFSLKAKTSRGQITRADLRVTYGKNAKKEDTLPVSFTSGSSIEAKADVGVDDVPLTAGMPVSYYWVLGNSNGDVAQTETKTVFYEDTRFSWRQRSGQAVTVRWYDGDEDYGNLMYSLAADALATYKRRFSISPSEHIYISIYGSSRDYFAAAPADVPGWSGGYTLPSRNEILAIAPQRRQTTTLAGEGIPHEVSHAALYQHLGHKYAPTWIDEGFAVYNQNVIAPEYDEMIQKAYQAGGLISLSNLDSSFRGNKDQALLAYAEGRSMVTFVINNYGDAVWANVLDQLRYGNADQAFQKVFGVKLDTLEEQWQNSLGGKKLNLPPALLKGPVSSVPPASGSNSLLSSGSFQLDDLGIIAIALLLVVILGVFGLVVVMSRKKPQSVLIQQPYRGLVNQDQNGNPVDFRGMAPPPFAPLTPPPAPSPMLPPVPPLLANNFNSSVTPPVFPSVSSYPANNFNPPPVAPASTGDLFAEADPFDIIAATFGNKPAVPAPPYMPYGAPPAADGGTNAPPSAYGQPRPVSPDSDPYGLGQSERRS